jgi:RNA 3'-phosphate cyclase
LIEIDGSLGEGGGQVLRSALALSILTGQAMRITNIRAGRSKPGLMAQHLKAVDAAAAISKASVQGAALNSTDLVFEPAEIRSGRYKFDIQTAGATTLVLQTIFLPLSRASSASSVIITGGTHVPWSPSYHYLELNWLPLLIEMGFDAQIGLDQAGFYPQGGGRISAVIRPASEIQPLNLTRRGPLLHLQGISAVANLPLSIAERQKHQALKRLERLKPRIKTVQMPSRFKGTLLLLFAEFENGRACFFGLGKLGKPAEQVADEAVEGLEAFLSTDGTVDPYLADQLLLPLSLANGLSVLHTSQVSEHLLTNAEILRAFLPVEIDIQAGIGEPGLVRVQPAADNSRETTEGYGA